MILTLPREVLRTDLAIAGRLADALITKNPPADVFRERIPAGLPVLRGQPARH